MPVPLIRRIFFPLRPLLCMFWENWDTIKELHTLFRTVLVVHAVVSQAVHTHNCLGLRRLGEVNSGELRVTLSRCPEEYLLTVLNTYSLHLFPTSVPESADSATQHCHAPCLCACRWAL